MARQTDTRIFSYHGGQRIADPWELEINIKRAFPDAKEAEELFKETKAENLAAIQEVVERLRKVFDMPPISRDTDGQVTGFTIQEVLGAFQEYTDWKTALKNAPGTEHDSPTASAQLSSVPSTTKPALASSSGATRSNRGKRR